MARKHRPQPVLCLPFVQANAKGGYNWWAVRSSGNYDRDFDTGRAYAVTYLEWRKVRGWPTLTFLLDSMGRSKAANGIKWGFLEVIDNAFMIGGRDAVAHQVRAKDREANYRISRLLGGVSL